MHLNRRAFLLSTALALPAGVAARAQSGEKLRACVIGDSNQGGYGHGLHLAFSRRDNIAVVGLADPDEAGRAKHAEESGAERTYADYREMLEKEKPDLVAVGPRWTIHHRDYLLACAEVGAHGFMEKPLCTDLAEADEMIGAIEARNLKWSIAFNVRGSAILQHVKQAVDDGLIGSLIEARARGKEDRRSGGEDLIVLGSHVLDLMRFFMDADPVRCAASITTNGAPAGPGDVREATEPLGPILGDTIHAMFAFPGGRAGYFDSARHPEGAGGRFGIDLHGSRGIISIRIGSTFEARWLDSPTWNAAAPDAAWMPLPGAPAPENTGGHNRYRYIVDDLLEAIAADRRPEVSLQDGRAVQEMIQAVFASHVARAQIAMPLENRTHPLRNWA